ncbi:MAG: hypothetical protein OER21_06195 [Gemmatimonadota bacterium]|nr:hypothetical protein [Gemmatimonadota bacterium]
MTFRRLRTRLVGLAAALAVAACARDTAMDDIARAYVQLVLAVGEHDLDLVDAYYGPPAWRETAHADSASLETLHGRADVLLARLAEVERPDEEYAAMRHDYLRHQVGAVRARVATLLGRNFLFDDESRVLYDAVAPHVPAERFQAVLGRLSALLPGPGPVAARYEHYRRGFVIPPARVDTVFVRAIAECRARTRAHLPLPEGERFSVEYVTGQPWSAYNWYQGDFTSVIQVNTDLPIHVDRAVDLACHEGYPGHHVYNALLEQHLVRERGWVEFSVYPLFSPQSLIAEGSANYGITIAFPGSERVAFERDVLFPLAGLDPAEAERYAQVRALVDELSYAGNEAARRYLDGEISGDEAQEWLVTYGLMDPPRAAQRLRFIDRYRSYVINYNLGQDLVARYVERHAGDAAAQRWQVFGELIGSPRLPSGLE